MSPHFFHRRPGLPASVSSAEGRRSGAWLSQWMRTSSRLLGLTVLLANLPLAVPFSLAPAWAPSHLSLRSRCAGIRCVPVRSAAGLSAAVQPLPVSEMGTGTAAGERKIRGVLFDIDGTLFDSDPVHFEVFVDLLLKEGINGGEPIDEEFFRKNIAGRQVLLPSLSMNPRQVLPSSLSTSPRQGQLPPDRRDMR